MYLITNTFNLNSIMDTWNHRSSFVFMTLYQKETKRYTSFFMHEHDV